MMGKLSGTLGITTALRARLTDCGACSNMEESDSEQASDISPGCLGMRLMGLGTGNGMFRGGG